MATNTFQFPANVGGQILLSSAMQPSTVATMFQVLVLQILNIPVVPANPEAAYKQVRVGWQQDGQPAWEIDEDVCILTAKPLNDPFSRVRDQLFGTNNDISLNQNMSFTQVWSVHFTLYGPNAYPRAVLMVDAMALDWVSQWLAAPPPPYTPNGFYFVASYERPRYAPELFQRRWWNRVDVELRFNELVEESIVTQSAESVGITLIPSGTPTEEIPIQVTADSTISCQPPTSQNLRSYTQVFTNVEQVTVTHNLGSYSVVVMVWSTTGQQLIPQTLILQSPDIAVVVFGVPMSGSIVVQGVLISGN